MPMVVRSNRSSSGTSPSSSASSAGKSSSRSSSSSASGPSSPPSAVDDSSPEHEIVERDARLGLVVVEDLAFRLEHDVERADIDRPSRVSRRPASRSRFLRRGVPAPASLRLSNRRTRRRHHRRDRVPRAPGLRGHCRPSHRGPAGRVPARRLCPGFHAWGFVTSNSGGDRSRHSYQANVPRPSRVVRKSRALSSGRRTSQARPLRGRGVQSVGTSGMTSLHLFRRVAARAAWVSRVAGVSRLRQVLHTASRTLHSRPSNRDRILRPTVEACGLQSRPNVSPRAHLCLRLASLLLLLAATIWPRSRVEHPDRAALGGATPRRLAVTSAAGVPSPTNPAARGRVGDRKPRWPRRHSPIDRHRCLHRRLRHGSAPPRRGRAACCDLELPFERRRGDQRITAESGASPIESARGREEGGRPHGTVPRLRPPRRCGSSSSPETPVSTRRAASCSPPARAATR